jgi:hypothetical protein
VNNARAQRARKPHWISDRDHQFACAHAARISENCRLKAARFDPQNRKISPIVAPVEASRSGSPVPELDRNVAGPHHMRVRNDRP